MQQFYFNLFLIKIWQLPTILVSLIKKDMYVYDASFPECIKLPDIMFDVKI